MSALLVPWHHSCLYTVSVTSHKSRPLVCVLTDVVILSLPSSPVEDGYSVWWQQDAQFLQPKLNLVCNIYSPISHETITDPRWTGIYDSSSIYTYQYCYCMYNDHFTCTLWNSLLQWIKQHLDTLCPANTKSNKLLLLFLTALTQLYAKMVLTSLDSLMYPATLLDYSVSINAIPHGLNVIISGYSDSTVMNNIIELVVNGNWTILYIYGTYLSFLPPSLPAMTNETMLSNSEMFSLSLESMTDSLTNYNYTAIPYRYIYQYIQR